MDSSASAYLLYADLYIHEASCKEAIHIKPISDISGLIFKAYQNEICIEEWTITAGIVDAKLVKNNNLLRYKLLKAVTLFKDKIFVFKFACDLFILTSPVKYFFDLARLGVSVITSPSGQKSVQDLVITDSINSHKNFSRVSNGFLENKDILHYKDFSSFSCFLVWEDIVVISAEIRRFRNHLKRFSNDLTRLHYKEIVLHSYDLVSVIAFVVILNKYKEYGNSVFFDQHIQRWAFIVSHVIDSQKSNLVQHGFLDASVSFTHPFGKINSASIVSNDFQPVFEKIYSVGFFQLLNTNLPITYSENVNQNITVFLASQPTSVELEIIFIEGCIKKNIDCLVKLHPKYSYASVFSRYKKFSCIKFIEPGVFPDCDVMVSVNSFLGYEYKSLGYEVYFLSNYPTIVEIDTVLDKMLSLRH